MRLPIVLFALVAFPAVGAAQPPPTPRQPERLFRSRVPLDLTLIAPLETLFKNRDTLDKRPELGVLLLPDTAGPPDTIPVRLETRGHFRLKRSTCKFPPIKVYFDKAAARETPFRGQGSLKLSTHCNEHSRYEQNVLLEEAIYRAYNVVTPFSLRTRLARIRYVPTDDTAKAIVRYAFFLEDDDEMAKRNHGVSPMTGGLALSDMDPAQMDLLALFEYMVGNTDWSVYALHNIRPVMVEGRSFYYPVAYDFDFSGLVRAPYARPDARLPIRNVQQRLYRGPCRTIEELTPALAHFSARKDSIEAVFRSQADLEPDRARDAIEYLDEFFDEIAEPEDFDQALDYPCRNR